MPEILIKGVTHTIHERPFMAGASESLKLSLGNKRMFINFHAADYATTFIKGTRGSRIPGATTALYTRVRDILQERAISTQTEIDYLFETVNSNMREWAMHQEGGTKVFGWHIPENRRGWAISQYVTFYPDGRIEAVDDKKHL